MRSVSSEDEFTFNDKWQSVFGVVTSKELRLYEVAPWSLDAWSSPLFVCSLLSTRLMSSSRNSDLITFSIRCGTEDGIITHRLKVDTQRDLATWARAIIQGCHNSVANRREVNCREYDLFFMHEILHNIFNFKKKPYFNDFVFIELFLMVKICYSL